MDSAIGALPPLTQPANGHPRRAGPGSAPISESMRSLGLPVSARHQHAAGGARLGADGTADTAATAAVTVREEGLRPPSVRRCAESVETERPIATGPRVLKGSELSRDTRR